MRFETTQWSLIQTAQADDTPAAREALAVLCERYWLPLYAYVRSRGYTVEEAQDLTQGFFERLLDKSYIKTADQTRGRFRTFLLTSLTHYLSNEWQKSRAQRRGKGAIHLSLDAVSAEEWYMAEKRTSLSADEQFDRDWALTVLRNAMESLRYEQERINQGARFEVLKACIDVQSERVPHAALAETLDISEGAVKVAVHRLRLRYRELIRQHIRQTVSSEEEIEDEVKYLLSALHG